MNGLKNNSCILTLYGILLLLPTYTTTTSCYYAVIVQLFKQNSKNVFLITFFVHWTKTSIGRFCCFELDLIDHVLRM